MVEKNEKKIIVVINGKEREIQHWNEASTYDNQQESYDPIPDTQTEIDLLVPS
mgnify:CR=1 FL=1